METEFQNTLACLLGAWMGSNNEKNGGHKSCDTLTLIHNVKFKALFLFTECDEQLL